MTRMSVSLALIVMLLLPCTVDWGWQKVFWTANASIAKSSEQLDQMWLQSWMPWQMQVLQAGTKMHCALYLQL